MLGSDPTAIFFWGLVVEAREEFGEIAKDELGIEDDEEPDGGEQRTHGDGQVELAKDMDELIGGEDGDGDHVADLAEHHEAEEHDVAAGAVGEGVLRARFAEEGRVEEEDKDGGNEDGDGHEGPVATVLEEIWLRGRGNAVAVDLTLDELVEDQLAAKVDKEEEAEDGVVEGQGGREDEDGGEEVDPQHGG